jgi:hypothetical protein
LWQSAGGGSIPTAELTDCIPGSFMQILNRSGNENFFGPGSAGLGLVKTIKKEH